MVAVASRAICLLGVRKNALGATALCLAAGFPDLITVVVLCDRPGMQQMAASNSFGAYAFNSFVALGLPWVILGLYSDVFPPARGTWYPAAVGFSYRRRDGRAPPLALRSTARSASSSSSSTSSTSSSSPTTGCVGRAARPNSC